MNGAHINSPQPRAARFGEAWAPWLRGSGLVVVLLLPGSFVVLPIIWLWHRWNHH